MTFDVAAESYDAFMGRYSRLLAPQMADFARVSPGQTALDVGCGPGALTAELVSRLGASAVKAVDPETRFVEAARARYLGVEVQQATAEALPFADAMFDVALAQLVVHFMRDPVGGIREMARVTRPGGMVAACVWDHHGDGSPLSLFWRAARELNPGLADESHLAGAREGHLVQIFQEAGLAEVEGGVLTAAFDHATFDEWWEPYTRGVGPAGVYVASLTPDSRETLRQRCRAMLPEPPFTLTFRAWAARGRP